MPLAACAQGALLVGKEKMTEDDDDKDEEIV
jgi:hypothetical protein